MPRRTLVVAIAALALSLAIAVPAFAAIDIVHNGVAQNPAGGSSLMVRPGGYKAGGIAGCVCHQGQYGSSANNNHGVYLRPVVTTVDVVSDNPYFGSFPGDANFSLNPLAPSGVKWLIGGLAIGTERYIFDGSKVATFAGVPQSVDYPRIGNKQWFMDFDPAAQGTTILPGRPVPTIADPWQSYTGDNYFTGSSNLTDSASDYGCIRCHSWRPQATQTATDVVYTIGDWGVTCPSCHARAEDTPYQATDLDGFGLVATAHNGPYYTGGSCDMCHQRNPVPANPAEGVPGRTQQLAQRIWETGQAARHRDQGFEVNKPPVATSQRFPGVVETTGGAGHPGSWAGIRDTDYFGQGIENARFCARCHTTQGYIAHTENGTDVPYSWVGAQKTFQVDLPTADGVSCVACHTTHGTQQGLNQFGDRAPNDYEDCADCHRANQLSMIDEVAGSTKKLEVSDIFHPTREMYEGRGAYGVDNAPSSHFMLGAACQYCHMPVTMGQPEADASHLFKTIMPGTAETTITYAEYPAGAGPTAPTTVNAKLPDDSCTGFGCHGTNLRSWLQTTLANRQSVITNRLTNVKAKLDVTQAQFATNQQWLEAQANYLMVLRDGSYGIHNYEYAFSALEYADGVLNNLMGTSTTPVERVFGETRFDTAVALSQSAFPAGSVSDIVMASGQNFPDALSAAGLAGTFDSPIMLTNLAAVPASVMTEIDRLSATDDSQTTIWIVGGAGAVSPAVVTQLQIGGYTVERVFGADRYDTSIAVANLVADIQGAGFVDTAFIANGTNFADALAASPVAWANDMPILLTPAFSLTSDMAQAYADLGYSGAIAVGGTAAVSANVVNQLAAISGAGTVDRWFGDNRFATAVDIANEAEAAGMADFTYVGVANGMNFPDALAGGPVAGSAGGVMILVTPTTVPPESSAFFTANATAINQVEVYGGTGAVSEAVRVAIYDLLN